MQLVLHYDGAGFSGWQRQPEQRTVQGVLEDALERVSGCAVTALGSGRTDAGVHARGQAVGVRVSARWNPSTLRRAINAVLPPDVWVADASGMRSEFHARYSAVNRRYVYHIGTDAGTNSPFRKRYEYAFPHSIVRANLDAAAATLVGEHSFRGFSVRGTAPDNDSHCCSVRAAAWHTRPGGLAFEIEANRFLHHMVRFLIGTMLDIGTSRRPLDDMTALLSASDNREVSPPAPAHGLFLDRVDYPPDLYLDE
ncbi:MAG TPA: tRNA pseudouridine(38-40) synthase TruA [Gemmatimonadaceae bacterium]|nr:tRNA pseudouridine(38-40) synthase TruA [Gemmatimonadaceae bacterium]